MAPFEVLMPLPGMPEIATRLERRVTLHKLWEVADRQATLAEIAPNVRAVVSTWATARVDAELMRRLPKLEIVVGFGVGYDHIDAAWAGRHGIVVTHTPGVLDADVADLAIALTLAATRRLPQAERHLRDGRWPNGAFPLTASLQGRLMGVLGLGRIGKAIARRAEAFGLNIAYHGRQKQDGVAYPYYATPLALAEACDILMVAAPGGPETRHVVDARVLAALSPNGVLVNIARGSLVDERALIAALSDGVILAAGLDVYEQEPSVPAELMALDNAVLLPHVGSATGQTRAAMANLVVDNLLSWIDGEGPLTPTPETPWRR